jgi:multiple sugar transport system substrate-binding protein
MVATAQRYSERHPGVAIHWQKRSLQQFAQAPIEHLARRFDFLVIDHPSVGGAASCGALLPLDQHLPADFLASQARSSVGQSHESYFYGGHQWALAVDAAAPVSGYRADLMDKANAVAPRTWAEMMELARRGVVAAPGTQIDCLCHFFMLSIGLGEEPFGDPARVVSETTGVRALEMLRDLMQVVAAGCQSRDPIAVWELMTAADGIAFCPFGYAYSNYGRASYTAHPLRWGGLVTIDGYSRCRSTLGGAGLAISARCRHLAPALAYLQFVAGPASQTGLYFESGGQPGHRASWIDEGVNNASNQFFRDTLETLDEAWVRPRWPGFIEFQHSASEIVHRAVWDKADPREALAAIDSLLPAARLREVS